MHNNTMDESWEEVVDAIEMARMHRGLTQAALAAAKGTGYVVGHSAGRWCCEALFFLVWSCPQPVMAAQLCELAGISD